MLILSDVFRQRASSRHSYFLRALVAALFAGILIEIPTSAEIIPADRRVDWTVTGIPGGIPNRTTVFVNVLTTANSAYKCYGDGTTDDRNALNAAIAACPSNQVVYLPTGTYNVGGQVQVRRSGVTIRGDGPGKTVVKITANPGFGAVYLAGLGSDNGDYIQNVASGYTKGSTNLVLAAANNINVGDALLISQVQDGNLVYAPTQPARVMGQLIEVKSISGNNITFTPPLFYWYTNSLSPQVAVMAASASGYYPIRYTGLENLTVTNTAAATGWNVIIQHGRYCWLKNVEVAKPAQYNVFLYKSLFCEIQHCFIHEAQNYGSSQGYGVLLYDWTTGCRVENNIFNKLICPLMTENGSSGNVIAYNYSGRTIAGSGELTNWLSQAINTTHGAHPMMNLWEGNAVGMVNAENYFGSGSHQTFLRNWITGSSKRTTSDGVEDEAFVQWLRRCVSVDARNYYYNFVGNLLGNTFDPLGSYDNYTNADGSPKNMTYHDSQNRFWSLVFRLGYPNMGNNDPSGFDPKTQATLLRHGNWDSVTSGINWDGSIADHTIPSSYYLAGKPSWFGDRPWPVFDTASPSGLVGNYNSFTNIPAGYRFFYGTDPLGATTPPTSVAPASNLRQANP